MDLEALATFVRVVDDGSVSAAALALGLPKSTVSRRIARLERLLGVRLVERTPRRARPTDEGQLLYERAASALSELELATAEVRDLAGGPAGLLRVTAPNDLGSTHLPDLIAAFRVEHPNVRFHVELTGRRIDLLREGFDVAFRAGAVGDDSLAARPLGVVESWFVASPAFVAEHGMPTSPEDLADAVQVAFIARPGMAAIPLEGPGGRTALLASRGGVSSNDFMFIRNAVRRGSGFGLVPAFVAKDDLESGRLLRVLPEWAYPGAPLHFVHAAGRYVPARVRAFREFSVEWFSRQHRCPGMRSPRGASK